MRTVYWLSVYDIKCWCHIALIRKFLRYSELRPMGEVETVDLMGNCQVDDSRNLFFPMEKRSTSKNSPWNYLCNQLIRKAILIALFTTVDNSLFSGTFVLVFIVLMEQLLRLMKIYLFARIWNIEKTENRFCNNSRFIRANATLSTEISCY